MNTLRINALLILSLLPACAFAQSYWFHRQLRGSGTISMESQIASVDSTEFLLSNGVPDFEAVTTDYGSTWTDVVVDTPKYNIRKYALTCFSHPTRNLLLIGCNDHQVGHIIRSSDGGSTWKDTTIGSYTKGQPVNFITAMAALDSTHFAALIGDTVTYLSNHLMLSSNAGVTWRSVQTPELRYWQPASGWPANPILQYLDDSTLIVAEDSTNNASTSVVFRTTNLGSTWQDVYRPNSTITKFAFVNNRVGFASGVLIDVESSSKTQTATIDKTIDGGATWVNIYTKTIVPISTSVFNNTAGLYSIAFADSMHGIACGAQGLILQTNDAGATWDEMHSDYTVDAQGTDLLTDVAYPDTEHAMITSSDAAVLIYQAGGLLELPNITYPHFSPPSAQRSFDIEWDPVPNAIRYSLTITTSGYPDSTTALYLKDTSITTTHYRVNDLLDTTMTTAGRQYQIYLQAFNAKRQSNVAKRTFIVYKGTSAVSLDLESPSIEVYPNPASHWLKIVGVADASCMIMDILGRTFNCTQQSGRIDISNLSPGVYYLYVGAGLARATFVKN